MKLSFGGLVLIFIFYVTETEASQKIKTEYTAAAAVPDDEAHRYDHRTIQDIGAPAREKKPRASPSRWDGFELARSLAQSGGAAHDMFVDCYREKGQPNPLKAALHLYDARHADDSYHLPEEQGGYIDHRFDKARRAAPAHADHRYHNQNNVRHQSRTSGSSSGNNQPDASPPKTPLDDTYSHLDVQPPQYYLDLNLKWVPNKSSPSGGKTGRNH